MASSKQGRPGFSPFNHWLSLTGVVLAGSSVFAFFLLLILDLFAPGSSPYLGILTFLVAPMFFASGLGLIGINWIHYRRRLSHLAPEQTPAQFTINFSSPRTLKRLGLFALASAAFLLVTAVGSYQTYHVTKSVTFCGTACHEPMEPQFVTYQHSPHARVACTDCHIGPGAVNLVRAKVNGLNQVYQVAVNGYERPITGHGKIHINQQTCEQCHWPQRFVGNLDRTYNHFLDDETNTPYSVRLSMFVGGGDANGGPSGGIHWHMNLANKVEYIALDDKKQEIPWIRFTDAKGNVRVYKLPSFTEDPAKFTKHAMDCMDCHNRPAHQFTSPNDAVEAAMLEGAISTKLPAVKKAAVLALTGKYQTRDEGLKGIETSLRTRYGEHPDLNAAIAAVQDVYRKTFFPEMRTDWRSYNDNIGHKDSKGCFRCHDNEHVAEDGVTKVSNSGCNSCHVILGESKGGPITALDPKGLEFKHPEEGWDALGCADCHNGTMEP